MDLSTLVRGCQGIKRGVTKGLLFGFFLGAVLPFQLNDPPILSLPYLLLFGCLVVASIIPSLRGPAFAFCLGFVWSWVCLERRIAAQFPNGFEKFDLKVVATVESMPVIGDRSSRFIATLIPQQGQPLPEPVSQFFNQRFSGGLVSHPRKVRLSWYHSPQLSPGQRWLMTIRLRKPRGFVNPRGFDYQAWLLSEGILATGYVRSGRLFVGGAKPTFSQKIASYRLKLKESHFNSDSTLKNKGLIQALMLGDTTEIKSQDWDILNTTGTIHLMAISGLHVGLMALLFYWLGFCLLRLIRLDLIYGRHGACIRWVAFNFPYFISIVAALFYSLLAGFSVPTQRALIFVLLVNLAKIYGRKICPFWIIGCAAAVIVLMDPFSIMQRGFWLSFLAVAILIYVFRGRNVINKPKPLWGVLVKFRILGIAQFSLFLGLAVPLALFGNVISLISPIANAIAVPFASFCVVPWVILAASISSFSIKLSQFLLSIADYFIGKLFLFLKCLCGIFGELSTISLNLGAEEFGYYYAIFGLITILLMLSPRGIHLTLLGSALALLILSPINAHKPPLKITFLDVGQGLSVIIETSSKTVLYDTGAKFSDNFDIGSGVILPYLKTIGVNSLDRVIVSHGDNDHAGGLASIVKAIPVKKIILGERHNPVFQGLNHLQKTEACKLGDGWKYDGVEFEFIWPSERTYQQLASKPNNQSCVLQITFNEQIILLTGDIENNVEKELLLSGLPRNLQVLSAAHHGSKTSSSKKFIQATQPKHVVVSSGYMNRYGHPHPKVIQRYEDLEAQIWNTANQGAISFEWSHKSSAPKVVSARQVSPKLWYSAKVQQD